jgi:putative Ca2+/H+ antiporter (TMEM165/GDT1 family)
MGKWALFFTSVSALAASSAVAVVGGELVARFLHPSILKLAAGTGFI